MVRKPYTLTLSEDVWPQVDEYRERMGYETMAEATRDLVRQAISGQPEAAIAVQVRREEQIRFRRFVFNRLAMFLKELEGEMKEYANVG
jgi:hypothetical protein